MPPAPIRELRDLTRTRTAITRERSREVQQLEKLLEDAGIKLSSVATDIVGVSGRAMLQALAAGERDPVVLRAQADRGSFARPAGPRVKALQKSRLTETVHLARKGNRREDFETFIADEEALEAAQAELRRYDNDPSQWSAFESMDKHGKRSLNLTAAYFERRSAAQNRIQVAQNQLLATKRAFLAGVLDEGAGHAAL